VDKDIRPRTRVTEKLKDVDCGPPCGRAGTVGGGAAHLDKAPNRRVPQEAAKRGGIFKLQE